MNIEGAVDIVEAIVERISYSAACDWRKGIDIRVCIAGILSLFMHGSILALIINTHPLGSVPIIKIRDLWSMLDSMMPDDHLFERLRLTEIDRRLAPPCWFNPWRPSR